MPAKVISVYGALAVSYQVFARKYRPQSFKDVLGQDHVVQTLSNAIAQNRLAHAYLFVGPRGTGKTSTARILAKALNCSGGPKIDFDPTEDLCIEIAEGRSLDVTEIDGASNNGVDNVRDLRENVQFAPSRGNFRIIYIDEVHMLSTAAFNALLKILEEPPSYVKFIFATTEANKVLPTIISRCQRFDLRPIDAKTIANHLLFVSKEEGVVLDEGAAFAIAKGADGGMRDALSMLDQLVAFCGNHITEPQVLEIFGFTSRETIAQLCAHILDQDTVGSLGLLHQQAELGRDLSQLLSELIGAWRELLVAKIAPDSPADTLPPQARSILLPKLEGISADRLLTLINHFADTDGRMRWAANKRLHFEIGLIKAIHSLGEANLSDVIKAISGAADSLPTPSPIGQTPIPVESIPANPQSSTPAPPQASETRLPSTEPAPKSQDASPNHSTTLNPAEVEPTPSRSEHSSSLANFAEPSLPLDLPDPIPSHNEAEVKDFTQVEWQELRFQLNADRPLLADWLDDSQFLGSDANSIQIGLPITASHARDSILRANMREFLEERIFQLCGQQLQIRVELREDILPSATNEEEDEEGTSNLLPEPPKPKTQTLTKSEITNSEPDPATNNKVNEEEFYKDPLILAALKIFETEIKKP